MNEPEKPPPFDVVKASFYLVAATFALYGLIILIAIIICAWHASTLINAVVTGKVAMECAKDGRLMEGLATLLASALAFAAGRKS